jgi:hypothetical protein
MVPAGCAVRALLALKLFGHARHSHVMSHVLDEGLALLAGLNVIPKRAFLTEYSCRLPPAGHARLMAAWLEAVRRQGLPYGSSFDLDFHTIPFHGEDAPVEKHYVSTRSRRQKGISSKRSISPPCRKELSIKKAPPLRGAFSWGTRIRSW